MYGFFFISSTENPSPKVLASVAVFIKENPRAIALILHNEKKMALLSRNIAILPFGCLFS